MATLCERKLKDNWSLEGAFSKNESTMSTSQVHVYRGAGGLLLKTPLKKRVTRGCWPTFLLSISLCVMEIADLKVLIVRYCFPA
jgi:hypothetical protein